MILGKFVKQPLEKESYSIDFADDLTEEDAIAEATVTVFPEGLTVAWFLIVGTRVKVMLHDGGPVGTKHKVTVTATTDDGRVMQDEFVVTIKDY